MKPASLLGVLACASLVLASSAAFAAPTEPAATNQTAPKKKKPKTSAKAPKKADTDKASDADKADGDKPATPAPVVPETKAADSKPADATPVVVGSNTGSAGNGTGRASADRGSDGARKSDEVEPGHFSAAPLLGLGSYHFGFGTGVRGGYTLPNKLYVGGTFMYHFGSTYEYGAYLGSDYSSHILYPAGEVGYEFHVGPVTIRPYAGVGVAFLSSSVTIAGREISDSQSSLLLYPGATAHWNIPKTDFFVGGDTRMVILTRGGDPSFAFYATGGVKF